MSQAERENVVMGLGISNNLAYKEYSIATEIRKFLDSIKDEGTHVDSGMGAESADLWVTVGGVEYFLTIGKSKAQQAKEGTN